MPSYREASGAVQGAPRLSHSDQGVLGSWFFSFLQGGGLPLFRVSKGETLQGEHAGSVKGQKKGVHAGAGKARRLHVPVLSRGDRKAPEIGFPSLVSHFKDPKAQKGSCPPDCSEEQLPIRHCGLFLSYAQTFCALASSSLSSSTLSRCSQGRSTSVLPKWP